MTKRDYIPIITYMGEKKIIIGLMSGTSVDSVDAAAVEIEAAGSGYPVLKIAGGITHDIPKDLKRLIFDLFEDGEGSLKNLCLANMRIGHLFADAALALMEKLSLDAGNVALIGSHGQTVYHVADRTACCGMDLRGSLQIGEASVIAQRTGVPVVSDFRVADIAAGGSGAPLVPFLDKALAAGMGAKTAFQNIGGIGNVSYFETTESEPLAFDTGPGNMIVDRLVSIYTGGRQEYDEDGEIGAAGRVLEDVLERWMSHPYLSAPVPKTTGREEFGTDFFRKWVGDLRPGADLIRTAEEFTARSIVDAYRRNFTEDPKNLVVCGGGAFNPVIMNSLKELMPETRVLTGDQAGISSEFKEAAAFALLAWCFDEGRPNNVTSATGAERPVVMGKLSKVPR